MRVLALTLVFAGCVRSPVLPSEADRGEVEVQIRRYRQVLLEPARVAPPSIASEPRTAELGSVTAVARPVRPEEAEWNRWEDGGPLLFNNRVALLFDLDIQGAGLVRWLPGATRVELNDDNTVLEASPSTEPLLGDLLYWAYLEERCALAGDLVARTRAAGPFRSVYLPTAPSRGGLSGVVAFPLLDVEDGELLADMHVVALRLTVSVEVDGAPQELSWVFD